MATDDDVEHEERVRRGAARHRAEQEHFDKRDEADRLAETGRLYKDREREIQARMVLNRMQQGSAATPSYRSSYTGPVRNRQIIDGKTIVSREELADFRRKFGADKTLRDLLNADKGRGPSAASPAARGVQGANVAPRGPRIRPDEAATTPSVGLSDIPGLLMRGMAEGAERVPAGRGLGAAFVGAGLPRAVAGARAGARVAEAAERPIEPMMATGRVRETGRFRSGSPSLREAQREAAEEMAREPALKKGGKVKAYAKGGSVRGSGCESRTKKTKYV